MEIVVKGRRQAEVNERFYRHAVEKLAKLEKFDPKAISLEVELSKERNPRQSAHCDRIELTMRSRGPVIRAEASAADPYTALDCATSKLEARLRRAADRRRVHHGRHKPVSVAQATAGLAEAAPPPSAVEQNGGTGRHQAGPITVEGEGPLVVREKTHAAKPITLDQALYEMELVGHDFYLFIDADRAMPSVVYRRRGYDYGVIRLESDAATHIAAEADLTHAATG